MNPPQVYMCSPSWTLLLPPSPYHPSGSSQCTSPKHPVLCIEPGLATWFDLIFFVLWIVEHFDLQHWSECEWSFVIGQAIALNIDFSGVQFSSVAQLCPTLCHPKDWLQHTRFPCSSPTLRACSNSCQLSRRCHPVISSSVISISSSLQSFPATESSKISQFFASGGQSIGVSALASVVPMNTQNWSPLGWNGCISLLSKGLSRVFSNTTVQKHQFFGAQLSL